MHEHLQMLMFAAGLRFDDSGRGGGAVWRAERAVGVEDFEAWLVARGRAAERMNHPPGWLVRTAPTWRAPAAGGHGAALREPYAGWAAVGRLLVLTSGGTPAAWPLTRGNDGRMWPVEGIEAVVAAAAGLAPAAAVPALIVLPFLPGGTDRAIALLTAHTAYLRALLTGSRTLPPDPARRPRGS
ncbi:hypothetical protein [Streptomyces sp. C10-9-1]|uniref:hypothetical protein n=1 Tax=Streptomyces sp. C10-9-1 TaxID=1859285 RepID=UPI003F4A44FF